MLSVGAVTEAAMDVAPVPLAVAKPEGVVITRLVDPAVSGWKVVGWKFESPLNTTGLVTMVPTAGLELITVTFTVSPARTLCTCCSARVAGSNCPDSKNRLLSGENVLVLTFAADDQMNPEGDRFTIAVP